MSEYVRNGMDTPTVNFFKTSCSGTVIDSRQFKTDGQQAALWAY